MADRFGSLLCYVAAAVKAPAMRIAVVKAAYDDEAGVWFFEHSDIVGLHVEGDTLESVRRNIADATADLVEDEIGGAKEIHIETRGITANRSASKSARPDT
jgi:predicted RNase H-like HicB family nuclease